MNVSNNVKLAEKKKGDNNVNPWPWSGLKDYKQSLVLLVWALAGSVTCSLALLLSTALHAMLKSPKMYINNLHFGCSVMITSKYNTSAGNVSGFLFSVAVL